MNAGPTDTGCLYCSLSEGGRTKGLIGSNNNRNNDENFHQHYFRMQLSILLLISSKKRNKSLNNL